MFREVDIFTIRIKEKLCNKRLFFARFGNEIGNAIGNGILGGVFYKEIGVLLGHIGDVFLGQVSVNIVDGFGVLPAADLLDYFLGHTQVISKGCKAMSESVVSDLRQSKLDT